MPESKEDARIARARALGLNAEGINVNPDAGQKQAQEVADRVEALGYIPSDGADLGFGDLTGEASVSVEELAETQKEANKQFTMPPEGQAAEKPIPPHSAEATSSGSSDEDVSEQPNKSASREEWDEYARSQGVDPEDFDTKEDLQTYFGVT